MTRFSTDALKVVLNGLALSFIAPHNDAYHLTLLASIASALLPIRRM
ncbi:hypothetical protein [Trueperella sp. LYQ143]